MKQKRTSIAAVLVLTAIMVPTGLPLRAQDSSDAAIERGKRMILSGDYARAAQVLRQAAKQLERLEDVQFFAAESNLGVALYHLSRFDEAESAYVRALEVGNGLAPVFQPGVLTAMNNLAILYDRIGRLDAAAQMSEKVLRTSEAGRGPGTFSTGNVQITLSGVYQEQGRYDEAEAAARRAVELFSSEHAAPGLESALQQLAIAKKSQGELEAADDLLARVRKMREARLGTRDPKTAETYAETDTLRLAQLRFHEGEELLQRAIGIWKQSGLSMSNQSAAAVNNLAQTYKLTGAYEKADPLYREALEICERTVGKTNPSYALFLGNFADLMRLDGRLYAAERLYTESIAILQARLSSDHPVIREFRARLASTHTALASAPAWTVDAGQLRNAIR